ncbi:MAG: hypothetical protein PWP55_573 [Clostridiales bacterium]|nr:hypothetical protein [Clostridiales bacterium]
MNTLKKQPNILFAIADDASHLGSHMAKFIQTPATDFVIKEGVLFNNAFTTNPKCAPSRASILTGRHTWQLEEACTHFCVFPNKFPLYPDILESAGYFVGYTGKGWAPGDWKRNGLKRNPAGTEFNEKKLTPPNDTKISNCDYAANFEDFLSQRPVQKPFYFWYGGREPHRPYERDEGLRAGKAMDDVKVPSYLPDDEIVKRDFLDYANEVEWFDIHLGKMLKKLEAIGELDNTIVVVTSDNGMPFPRVKGQMYEFDFKLPLVICWRERAKGGRVVDDIVSFIDFAPTFLETAGVAIPKEWPGNSLLDILLSDMDGLVNPKRNRAFMGRERHDMGRENDVGYPVRCIRTPEYLYIRNFKPELWPAGNPETGFTNTDSSPTKALIIKQHTEGNDYYFNLAFGKRPLEELYNIKEDPECMNNLAQKEEYKELKAELWLELKAELEKTGDPRIFGNGDIFDRYEYVGDAKHSWKNYVNGTFEPQRY